MRILLSDPAAVDSPRLFNRARNLPGDTQAKMRMEVNRLSPPVTRGPAGDGMRP